MPAKVSVVASAKRSPMDAAVAEYLANVEARGGSARTREYYESVLTKVFLPWAGREGISDPKQLSQAALDRLNIELLSAVNRQGRPLSRHTVNTYLRGVRQFVRWAQRGGLADAGARVQLVKVPKRTLVVLTTDEINAMEAAATNERDKLIIRLLGDGGLRLGELLGLKADDLVEQGRERYVHVVGKGDRDRNVPIRPQLYSRLRRYAEHGRPPDAWSSRLFVSLRRRPSGGYEALDGRAVQQMLKAVAARAGMKKPVHPHNFRHSMITNAIRRGVNLVILKEIVGHADLNLITNVYSHIDDSERHREMMRILTADD